MSLQRLADAVVELGAKIALGNPRAAKSPSDSARERILARNPRVPFDEMERGVVERLGSLLETTDTRAVDLAEQTLRRAVVGQDLMTEDITADGLFELLGGEQPPEGKPVAAYGSLLRACCWEVLDAVRALWNHLNAPSGSWRPRWRQLYSGGPIRSLDSIQLETGPYIVAGGENGTVMLDQFTGTTAQVDNRFTIPLTAVVAGFTPEPIAVCGTVSGDVQAMAIPYRSSKRPVSEYLWKIDGELRALAVVTGDVSGLVCAATSRGIFAVSITDGTAKQIARTPAGALAVAQNGTRAVLLGGADPDAGIRSYELFDSQDGPWQLPFPERVSALKAVMVSSRPHALAGGDEGALRLFDLRSGVTTELVGHSKTVSDIAVIEDSERPIAITVAGSIRVWDLMAGEQISTSLGSAHAVTTVRHLDRDYLLAGMDDGIYVTEISGLIRPPEPWEHAGFSTDVATGPDRLGIADDVETLAALMLAKEVSPPLAIGLFGDWGTGKSFFMATLNQRIKQLAADSTAVEESAFCSHVRQIEFNAWHYADANLWASLAGAIFDGLAVEDEPESLPSVQAARKEFERQRDEAEQKLQSINAELDSSDDAPVGFREALRNASLPEEVVKKLDAKSAVELRGFVSRVRFLFRRAGWPMRLLMLATVAYVVGGPALITTLLPAWTFSIYAAGAVIGTGIVLRATEALRTAEEIVRRVDEQRRGPLLRLIEKYEDEKAEAISQIGELDRAHSVRALAVERVTGAVYQKHEGVISIIRRDLKELSRRLTTRTDVERIVLYIDDLDRCPPDRVVDVLQAVHLLLAFPLFVVVVGVDSRWLLRSLRRHYAELMQSHETPQNYLEKIFQISLCLRPMTQQGYADLVTADLLPELVSPAPASTTIDPQRERAGDPQPDGNDPPTTVTHATEATAQAGDQASTTAAHRQRVIARALRLNRDERQLLIDAHPLIGTPRSAKRLVNVYRLLRAGLPPQEREQFTSGEFRAVIVLLGILVGFPLQGADLIDRLGTQRESTLLDILESHNDDDANDAGWRRLAEAVRRVSLNATDIPQDAETYARWAPRVARYSFRTGHLFNG